MSHQLSLLNRNEFMNETNDEYNGYDEERDSLYDKILLYIKRTLFICVYSFV